MHAVHDPFIGTKEQRRRMAICSESTAERAYWESITLNISKDGSCGYNEFYGAFTPREQRRLPRAFSCHVIPVVRTGIGNSN